MSFLGLGSEQKCYSTHDSNPQGEWDSVGEYDDDNIWRKRDTQISVARVHWPEERSKSRGGGKLSIHFCADGETETVFDTIISVIQLSIYGAVSDLCAENRACHVRTERLTTGQSDPLFVPTRSLMKTPTPSTDDPAQQDLLQKYQEWVERLSQQSRVIKNCTDAGFLTTIFDFGQYFMTKDTEQSSQFTKSVACREYALPRVKNHQTRKVEFEGTPKLVPCWNWQPVVCKVNMEWILELNL